MKDKQNTISFQLEEAETMSYQARLKKLRMKHKATQKQIAEYLGVSTSRYMTCEKGKYPFNVDEILKLAEAYNVSLNHIFNIDDTEKKETVTENPEHIYLAKLYDQVPVEKQKFIILLMKIFKDGKTMEDVLDIIKNVAPDELYEKMVLVDDGMIEE